MKTKKVQPLTPEQKQQNANDLLEAIRELIEDHLIDSWYFESSIRKLQKEISKLELVVNNPVVSLDSVSSNRIKVKIKLLKRQLRNIKIIAETFTNI